MVQSASEQANFVMGDRIADTQVSHGMPPNMECITIGVCNEVEHSSSTNQPALQQYRASFDGIIHGNRGSLTPITRLIKNLAAR